MSASVSKLKSVPASTETSRITIPQILAWADTHWVLTGVWPKRGSVSVPMRPLDLSWHAVDVALALGTDGLSGDQSLVQILREFRGVDPATGQTVVDIGAVRDRTPSGVILSVQQIATWAEEFRAEWGRWPDINSGQIPGSGGESWCSVNAWLWKGGGGEWGAALRKRLFGGQRLTARRRFGPFTVDQILGWADFSHKANGCWPTASPAEVPGNPGLTWRYVNWCLTYGGAGLPGGSSLVRLLAAHRGRERPNYRPRLTIEGILSWADAHHTAHGCWPTSTSGAVAGVPGETWAKIDAALSGGCRGLPGGSSVVRLLRDQRGRVKYRRERAALSPRQILAWADAHHAATEKWPREKTGPVLGAPGERWRAVDQALKRGDRGLPGGSTLLQFLAENGRGPRLLDLRTIVSWAVAEHAATGKWPECKSEPVSTAPGENRSAIEVALQSGTRGLPGGTTLLRALAAVRPYRSAQREIPLSVDQILAWVVAHRAATGKWPGVGSGPVAGAPDEKWSNINKALRDGLRGLPAGSSLAQLIESLRRRRPGTDPRPPEVGT
jgi:hypothetical protein